MEVETLDARLNMSTLDLQQACRGCLSREDLNSIHASIETFDETSIGDMFVECTSVIITETDGLPNQLCDNCIYQLNQAYLFRKSCQKIDETIRQYLKDNKAEIENSSNDPEEKYRIKTNFLEPEETLDKKDIIIREISEEEFPIETLDPDDPKDIFDDNISNSSLPEPKIEKLNNEENDLKPNITDESSKNRNTKERRFSCQKCGKSFLASGHLKNHELIHSNEKPYACMICTRAFNSKANLKRHTMTHTGERPFRCEECGKGFIQSVTLQDHLRVHTKETPYGCSNCKREFKQAGELRRHIRKCNGLPRTKNRIESGERRFSAEKTFLCSECGKSFRSRTLLHIHNRIHTGEKPYTCAVCAKSFSQISTLKTHMLLHTGERKFDCQECNKSFRHRIALKQHQLIHLGIKNHRCAFCSKTFTQSSQLSYHLRTHTGEKPYQCSTCHKTFALKGNLTVHMRTHTGETPYVCWICGKGFYDSSAMKKHHKVHGDDIPIKPEQELIS